MELRIDTDFDSRFSSFSSCYGCVIVEPFATPQQFPGRPPPVSMTSFSSCFQHAVWLFISTKGCILERLLLVLFNKSGRYRSTLRQSEKKRHEHRLKEINTLTHTQGNEGEENKAGPLFKVNNDN